MKIDMTEKKSIVSYLHSLSQMLINGLARSALQTDTAILQVETVVGRILRAVTDADFIAR